MMVGSWGVEDVRVVQRARKLSSYSLFLLRFHPIYRTTVPQHPGRYQALSRSLRQVWIQPRSQPLCVVLTGEFLDRG